MAKKNLYINNTNLGTYGVYISSDTVLNAPSFDYVEHQVPGRDGTMLQYNNRLNNVIRKFSCYIPEKDNVATALFNVKKLIYQNPGYLKIASDYEPGIFMYGYLAQELNLSPFKDYESGMFDLYFSCQPTKRTTSTALEYPNISQYVYYQENLFPRNYPILQEVFNLLPADSVPSGDWFVIRYINQNAYMTNVSASYTPAENNFVAIYSHDSSDDSYTIHGYDSNGSLTVPVIDLSGGLTKAAYAIYGYSDGVLNLDYNGNSYPYDMNDYTKPFTQTMFGFDISKITIKYCIDNISVNYLRPNQVVIRGENMLVIDADFERFGNTLFTELYDDWSTTENAKHYLTIEIDSNMRVNAVKGTDKKPLDSYFEITGEPNINGSTVKITTFAYGDDWRGAPVNVKLNALCANGFCFIRILHKNTPFKFTLRPSV